MSKFNKISIKLQRFLERKINGKISSAKSSHFVWVLIVHKITLSRIVRHYSQCTNPNGQYKRLCVEFSVSFSQDTPQPFLKAEHTMIRKIYLRKNFTKPEVGVTKSPFIKFSVMEKFDFAKLFVRFFKSHSSMTGVTAGQLQRHLPNTNVIGNSQRVFWQRWKIGKITKRRKLA